MSDQSESSQSNAPAEDEVAFLVHDDDDCLKTAPPPQQVESEEQQRARALDAAADLKEQAARLKTSPPPPDDRGWGVPDWRVASDYPKHGDLDRFEWRWEFLRRNHGFRADFLRSDAEFPVSKDLYFEVFYGLMNVPDPRKGVLDIRAELRRWKPARDFDLFPPTFEDTVMFADARLSNQYALAGEGWKGRWGPALRAQRRKWPTYLRVLDAQDSGASYGDIAKALFADSPSASPQAARDVIKAAKAHRANWKT